MTLHRFHAVAFAENFQLKSLAPAFPGARLAGGELRVPQPGGGELHLYAFGAAVFRGVDAAGREALLGRLRAARPGLGAEAAREEFAVEEAGEGIRLTDGLLAVDRLTPERAGVVALTVAQSSAMEYYERTVDALSQQAGRLLEILESRGRGPWRVRPLHRFIGAAALSRNEVLAVLHLLDKPDAVWDDPALERIYADLRGEFDLGDRYAALASKLSGLHDSLELLLGVARDSRLFALEAAVVALIVLEILLGWFARA